MGGGHYTAYCKNLLSQKWFLHDDSHVSEVNNTDQIISSSAYVLFYKLRTIPVRQPKAAVTTDGDAANHNSTNNNTTATTIANGTSDNNTPVANGIEDVNKKLDSMNINSTTTAEASTVSQFSQNGHSVTNV